MVRFDLPPPPPGVLERSNVEVVEAFLAALAAAGASAKTVKAYRAALMDFVSFIGGKPLREVSSSDVAAWVYERLSRGVRRPRGSGGGRGWRVTMHYYTLFLRGFFEWLGLDVKVPVVRKPRGSRVEALSWEEVEALLSAARDVLDLLIVGLLFETGLRAQEAVGLEWRDIDFSRRSIRVRNAKYGEERTVLFGPLTEAALREWLRLRRPRRGDERVLGISYSGLYKRLKSLARRAGVDPGKVRPHVLRHTFATEALRRGVPLPVVQRLLGHHDIKVTQVYLHLLDEDVRRAYERAFSTHPMVQPQQAAWQPPPMQAQPYPSPSPPPAAWQGLQPQQWQQWWLQQQPQQAVAPVQAPSPTAAPVQPRAQQPPQWQAGSVAQGATGMLPAQQWPLPTAYTQPAPQQVAPMQPPVPSLPAQSLLHPQGPSPASAAAAPAQQPVGLQERRRVEAEA